METQGVARSARDSRLRFLWIAALLVIALAFQGTRGIWEPDEGRYSIVASEMIRTGDWIHPQLHHESPHWTKPPLYYWAVASSLLVLGKNEFATRLPGALSFAATVLLVAFLGRLFVRRDAKLPAIFYAIAPLPFVACNLINTDTLLTLWETLAVACYAWAHWGEPRRRTLAIMGMWAAFGLAFLTKGPPGLLPLAAILAFRWLAPSSVERPPLRVLPGIVLLFAIGFSWYVVVVLEQSRLGRYFLWNELVLRVFSDRHRRHSEWYKPLTIYGPVLLAGSLPWVPALIGALRRNLGDLRPSRLRSAIARDPQRWFLIFWIAVPMLVFALARSRLYLYPLPLLVPMSLLAARHLEERGFQWTRRKVALIAAWTVILLAFRGTLGILPVGVDSRNLAAQIERAHPGPLREIVFVDSSPYRGLWLYLDVEVEEIDLVSRRQDKNPQDLCDELSEAEETRLWVVPSSDAQEFLRVGKELGVEFESCGGAQGKKSYALFMLVSS